MSRPRALETIRDGFQLGASRAVGDAMARSFRSPGHQIEWPENERGRLPNTSTPQNLEVNLNTSGNFNDTNLNKKAPA